MIYGLKDETVTQRQRVEGAERGEGRLLTLDREGQRRAESRLATPRLPSVGRCWPLLEDNSTPAYLLKSYIANIHFLYVY